MRRALFALLGVAGLYVVSYGMLSLGGADVSSSSGAARLAGGGPTVNDVTVWRPRFVTLRIFLSERGTIEREANFLGWLFYPLELLDRRYWHPTKHPLLDLLHGVPPAEPPPGSSAQ